MYKAHLATFTNMWLFARMRRRLAQPRAQVVTFLFSKKQRIAMKVFFTKREFYD